MHSPYRRLAQVLQWGFGALLAISLAACSSIDLNSAVALGNTGVQTATTYQQSINAITPSLDRYMEGQSILAALTDRPPPDQSLESSVAALQSASSARAAMLGQLAQVYSSFIALASYDASGQVKTSLTSLDGSINNFATQLNVSSPPIPSGADALISDAGGIAASQIQKHKVLKASEAISARLRPIIDLLGKENDRYADIEEVLTRDSGETAVAFWRHGIGSPDQIFSDQIGSFGLTYTPGSFVSACNNMADSACKKELDAAVIDAVKYRSKRVAGIQVQTIASNQAALAALVTAHKQFEQGQPLDLAAITAQLALVRSLIDDINNANKNPA